MKKAILCVLLCFSLFFSSAFSPRAKAVDIVLTPTILGYIIYGMVAAGVVFEASGAAEEVGRAIWEAMTEAQKELTAAAAASGRFVTDLATGAVKYVVSIGDEVWEAITGWVSSTFDVGHNSISYPGTVVSGGFVAAEINLGQTIDFYFDISKTGYSRKTLVITPDPASPWGYARGEVTTYFASYQDTRTGSYRQYRNWDQSTYFPYRIRVNLDVNGAIVVQALKFLATGEWPTSWASFAVPDLGKHEHFTGMEYVADVVIGGIVGLEGVIDNPAWDFPAANADRSISAYPQIGADGLPVVGSDGIPVLDFPRVLDDVVGKTYDDVMRKPDSVPYVGDISVSNPAEVDFPDVITGVDAGQLTGADIDTPNMRALFLSKFPFCLPWDLKNAISLFAAPAEPPRFEVDFIPASLKSKIGVAGDTSFVLDLDDFELLGQLCRWMFLIGFSISLILVTRKIIKS